MNFACVFYSSDDNLISKKCKIKLFESNFTPRIYDICCDKSVWLNPVYDQKGIYGGKIAKMLNMRQYLVILKWHLSHIYHVKRHFVHLDKYFFGPPQNIFSRLWIMYDNFTLLITKYIKTIKVIIFRNSTILLWLKG